MRAHYVLTWAVMVLFLSSCKDEPAEIAATLFGDNLINTNLDISAINELQAQNVATQEVDFKNKFEYLMLGELNDPAYGDMKAEFASELTLGRKGKGYSISSLLNDTVRFIDTTITPHDTSYIPKYEAIEYISTDFKISYKLGAWIGDTLATHKVSVYELTSRLDSSVNYTSNYNPASVTYESNPIGELEYFVKNNQTDTMWDESGYVHSLEVELNEDFGMSLFNADSETINDEANFKNFFKGVFVTTEKTDDSEGSMLKLNYRSIDQGIYLNYRGLRYTDDVNGNDSVVYDTLSWDFPINLECTKAIKYESNFTNSAIDFSDTNTDKIYLQGMGSTYAQVNITDQFIERWKATLPESDEQDSEKITSIASVELSFYVDTVACYNQDVNFRANLPSSLSLYIKNSEGDFTTPLFDLSENYTDLAVFSGGTASATPEGGIKYTFSLQTGFFEEFIHPTLTINEARPFNELYLMIPSSEFSFDRVILHGMSIDEDANDETVMRSNMSVRYVEVE